MSLNTMIWEPLLTAIPADSWPAVLQGVEAEVGELGHLFARGPDPEHTTGVLGTAVLGVEVVVQATICASSRRQAR